MRLFHSFEATASDVRLPHQLLGTLNYCEGASPGVGLPYQFFVFNSINCRLLCFLAILMVPHCSSDDPGGVPLVPPCFFMSASYEKGLRNLEAWESVCKARISVRKIVEPVLTVSELTTLKWKFIHF